MYNHRQQCDWIPQTKCWVKGAAYKRGHDSIYMENKGIKISEVRTVSTLCGELEGALRRLMGNWLCSCVFCVCVCSCIYLDGGCLLCSTCIHLWYRYRYLVVQMVKNLPATQETLVWSLSQEDPLEKGMDTKSSILTWWITVHGVAKSRTWLNDSLRHTHTIITNVKASLSDKNKCRMLIACHFFFKWECVNIHARVCILYVYIPIYNHIQGSFLEECGRNSSAYCLLKGNWKPT